MDKNAKNQIAKRLKEATNVLVTVSSNPSVDQIAAAIGLSLFLGKLKKHSTAVYSGDTPDTIGFLKPEETLEPTTDALQDFIIALDKAKADKIRYKVEDDLVKIFITPYRSSVGEEDLQFSMGDFNVDVVVALGVHNKDDIDQAITSHGRILHDATVATVNTGDGSELGSLNWTNPDASSLCEMIVSLTDLVKSNALDAQMATALLTGIVSETERFSNEKTTSVTMNASAKLMAAGANQQLVASELEEEVPDPGIPPEKQEEEQPKDDTPPPPSPQEQEGEDGALHISHEEKKSSEEKHQSEENQPNQEEVKQQSQPPVEPPQIEKGQDGPPKQIEEQKDKEIRQVRIDPEGKMQGGDGPGPMPSEAPPEEEFPAPQIHRDATRRFLENPPSNQGQTNSVIGGAASQSMPLQKPDSRMITTPPTMGSKLSAMSDDFYGADENDEGPLNLPQAQNQILDHNKNKSDKKPDSPADGNQPPPNLDRAAEPSAPETPPAEPEAEKTEEPPKTVKPENKAEESGPSLEEKMRTKLPQSFVKSLDEKTLKDIESKTNSPHREQIVKGMEDKTLDSIEQTVNSPHLKAEEKEKEESQEDKDAKLDYEPHESEPPTKDEAQKPEGESDSKPAGESEELATDNEKQNSGEESKPGEEDTETDAARKAVEEAINKGGDGRASLPALEGIGSQNVDIGLEHEPSHTAKTVLPPDSSEAEEEGTKDEGAKAAEPTSPPVFKPEAATEIKSQYTQPSPKIEIDPDGNLSYGEKPPDTPPPLPPDHTASGSTSPSSAPLHQSSEGSDGGKQPPSVPPPMMPPS